MALATATCASSLGMVPGIGHPLWWGVAATVQFFSLLPGVPADEVPVGGSVEVMFEEVAPGTLIPEWRVV